MKRPEGLILVIFGATGDLAARKLMPALCDLNDQNLLPGNFVILGTGRTAMDDSGFRVRMDASADRHLTNRKCAGSERHSNFMQRLYYESIDTALKDDFKRLHDRLSALDREHGTGGNYLFYLATPPQTYESIIGNLAYGSLNRPDAQGSWRRIIIEKPFGYDLASAQRLNAMVHGVFTEEQIFRIDHYLGKETVQNILVTRFANGIFEPLWNRNFIERVEITSAESISIEGRGSYYDSSGAMRDMVQNHLLQLVGLIAMEPPAMADARSIRNETMKVFQSLRPLTQHSIEHDIIRGQYTASVAGGETMAGYREEASVGAMSRTETYVAMKFFIDNWRWSGVPFYIRTGKRLPIRVTEVVIHFRTSPHILFSRETGAGANQLVIRIQPDEGLLFTFGMKVPGAGFTVRDVSMDFHYSDLSDIRLPDAYERLLLDCMLGDATLFSRGDAVEETWRFIDPVLKHWEANPHEKLYGYPAGTWGPDHADDLIEGDNDRWRYPCKNLTNDSSYCEL